MGKANKIVFVLTDDEETKMDGGINPLMFSGGMPYIIDEKGEEIPLVETGTLEDIEKIACAFQHIGVDKMAIVRFQIRMPIGALFPLKFPESEDDNWALFVKK